MWTVATVVWFGTQFISLQAAYKVPVNSPHSLHACLMFVSQCGLSSHKKCLENLRTECGHKEAADSHMTTFGVDFTTHVAKTSTDIPLIVAKCITEIDQVALDVKVCVA